MQPSPWGPERERCIPGHSEQQARQLNHWSQEGGAVPSGMPHLLDSLANSTGTLQNDRKGTWTDRGLVGSMGVGLADPRGVGHML